MLTLLFYNIFTARSQPAFSIGHAASGHVYFNLMDETKGKKKKKKTRTVARRNIFIRSVSFCYFKKKEKVRYLKIEKHFCNQQKRKKKKKTFILLHAISIFK